MDDSKTTQTQGSNQSTEDATRMGQPVAQSVGSGSPSAGPPVGGDSGSDLSGGISQVSPADGNHLRERHLERVPRPEDVDTLRDRLIAAFKAGPEQAWEVSQSILRWADELVVDTAKLRFKTNFGTERCRNCSGLKAGPGIAATCYQVQQCFYSSIREDDLTRKQAKILEYLANPEKSTE